LLEIRITYKRNAAHSLLVQISPDSRRLFVVSLASFDMYNQCIVSRSSVW